MLKVLLAREPKREQRGAGCLPRQRPRLLGCELAASAGGEESMTAQPLCKASERRLVHQVLHHREAEVLEESEQKAATTASCDHYGMTAPTVGGSPATAANTWRTCPDAPACRFFLARGGGRPNSKTRPARASPSQTMSISQSQARTHPVNSGRSPAKCCT